jgi:putative drug exporter of the RND superfamily
MSRGAGATAAEAKGLFGRVGVFVLRWPWIVIGFWVALAAVLSLTFPPLTQMASKRPVAILPSDAPVLATTRQISKAFHQSGSENENVLLVVLTDETGLDPSDDATYRALADNLRPDTRDIVMLQDFVSTPALREAVTSKDHKAWYLPMVLAGGVGTPELHAAYSRVADIVKQTVAGSTLTANLTGPAATGDDLMYIGIRDMHVIETAVVSALGVGVIVFQFILHQELTWSVPGLTFIVLVAMGADYNLLLISRLRDESPYGIRSGVIRTVGSTGGVITAAGVIFAASMYGLLFASISTLVQSGFIIGTGLLLDTFLVRTITVPAIAVLVGQANWWPSRLPPESLQRRRGRLPTPDSGSTSEASDGTVHYPGASRNGMQTDVADHTDSDIVALRS